MKIEDTTVMVPYGGFSSSVVADYRFVHPLPDSIPSEAAAVLMCAGLTVYSALCTHVTKPGLKVAIVGVGGLGHLAIQFAHALGYEVKENQALGFGAREFLASNDSKRLREAAFAFDLLVCTANAGISWGALLTILRKRGKLVLLGFPDVTFNSTYLVAHELAMVGSLIGNPPTMRAMISFAQQHYISPMVELMPMCEVNEAVRKLKEKQARYRVVLVNDMAAS